MKPNFRNFLMKKPTREMVVPIISARASKLILAITFFYIPATPAAEHAAPATLPAL